MLRPHLQGWVQLWAPRCSRDMNVLEAAPRRVLKMIEGLEHTTDEERLRKLGVCCLEK